MLRSGRSSVLALAVVASPARAELRRSEQREDCAQHEPLRRPFFGDTHVHTALSFDSVGQGTRNRPADAYRRCLLAGHG